MGENRRRAATESASNTASRTTPNEDKKMSANLAMYTSLSLLGLCALAGSGVGVGSEVAMMTMQMMEAEEKKGAVKPPAAASPVEKVKVNARALSFAASGIKSQN